MARHQRWIPLLLVTTACAGGVEQAPASTPSPTAPETTTTQTTATHTTTTQTTAAGSTLVPGADGAAVVPDVDLSISNVSLDDVYFDTFDGGAVRLSDSTAVLRAALLDAIPPIDAPAYGDVTEGDWLESTDLVLGYVADGTPYAFPFKILNYHEIVNDEVGGVPVLISYCPLCRSAVVYDRRVGGRELTFGNTSALYESDMVMVDRQTGSYWWQVPGEAIVGELTGQRLDLLPSAVATWADWADRFPDTLVLTRETGFIRPYERDPFAGYAAIVDAGGFAFPVGEAARDGRLPASELVLGIQLEGLTMAYPISLIDGIVNDRLGTSPVVVVASGGGAVAFHAHVDGSPLTFDTVEGTIVDRETGSSWDRNGNAVAGPLVGSVLEPIPGRTTFWFSFVGAFPSVDVWAP